MEEFRFDRPGERSDEDRLEALANLVAFKVLGNTERGMIRKLAEPGEPLDLVVQGLLAYSDEARYHIGRLDLEDEEEVERGKRLVRERKYIDFTIRLLERILTPLPEPQQNGETK